MRGLAQLVVMKGRLVDQTECKQKCIGGSLEASVVELHSSNAIVTINFITHYRAVPLIITYFVENLSR